MSEPILDPRYWDDRLLRAGSSLHEHHAVYLTSDDDWAAIERTHRRILAEIIKPNDAILDAGCAWGRLLDLLPDTWHGVYHGVDLSPGFIEKAKSRHPQHWFKLGDISKLDYICDRYYDHAVLISIKGMIVNNLGMEYWETVEKELRRVANNLIILEYEHD